MTTAAVHEHHGRPVTPTYTPTRSNTLTVTEPDRPHPATGSNDPVAEALRTQQTFDRSQVAWLMSQAMRWGYELRDEEDRGWLAGYNARVAEENQTWPPPKVFALGRWFDQATERARADAAARLPRPGDFKGHDNQRKAAA